MYNCRLPITLLLLLLQQRILPVDAKFESPDWSQLVKFPSTSTSDAFDLKWDATNKATPAKLFLWKGPPENFTLVTAIPDARGNTDLKNTGSLTWVIKDGEVPSSGKDYAVELRLNPGVNGKESSQWSNYFEMFNEEKPDPQNDQLPSVYNIGTAAPVGSASALPTTPVPLPPASVSSNSDSTSSSNAPDFGIKTKINLTSGALAGVVIGTILGSALLSSLVTFLIVRRRMSRRGNDIFRSSQPMPPAAPMATSQSATLTAGGERGSHPEPIPSLGLVKNEAYVESRSPTFVEAPHTGKVREGVSELY